MGFIIRTNQDLPVYVLTIVCMYDELTFLYCFVSIHKPLPIYDFFDPCLDKFIPLKDQ
jgi:hypothetical protein